VRDHSLDFKGENKYSSQRAKMDSVCLLEQGSVPARVGTEAGWEAGMSENTQRIRITVGAVQLEAELMTNKTANEIYAALPVEASVNTWGDEFYFKVPGVKDYRETATTQVKIGDVAFWGAGQMLAIFFGRTPMSMGADPVPADRVNVIGRILGDATALRRVMDAAKIKIERV
jgi:hypothetical protein